MIVIGYTVNSAQKIDDSIIQLYLIYYFYKKTLLKIIINVNSHGSEHIIDK